MSPVRVAERIAECGIYLDDTPVDVRDDHGVGRICKDRLEKKILREARMLKIFIFRYIQADVEKFHAAVFVGNGTDPEPVHPAVGTVRSMPHFIPSYEFCLSFMKQSSQGYPLQTMLHSNVA